MATPAAAAATTGDTITVATTNISMSKKSAKNTSITTTSANNSSCTSKNTNDENNEDYLRKLGLLPSVAEMSCGIGLCKPCDPMAGLTLGGKPITKEKLDKLGPDDLMEDMLMQNGEPLSIAKLAELLGFDDAFGGQH